MHKYALNTDAALTCIAEAADCTSCRRKFNVRVVVNDASCVAAELQSHTLLAASRFQLPTHGCATGETQHLEAIIFHEGGGVLVRKIDNAQCTFRPACAVNDLGQHQRT